MLNHNSNSDNSNDADGNCVNMNEVANAGSGNNRPTTGNGFTSFSISSILSRNEPSKKHAGGGICNGTALITPIPHLPQPGAAGAQDAAMLSR